MNLNRRNFLKTSSMLSLSPYFLGLSSFMTDNDFTMEIIRNDIGYFTKRGGTIGFMLSPGGKVIVDTQFPASAELLIAEIKKKDSNRIDLLINTHHHGDHTAGNIAFAPYINASVAHENSVVNQKKSANERGNLEKQFFPGQTFKEEWTTMIGKELITMSHFGPAHTNGDAMVHFENSDIIHMGDLVFNRRFPYIDKNNGADIANWIQVLDKATEKYLDSAIFIFGHAADGYEVTGSKEDIKAFKRYLEQLMNYMEKEVKAGKSVEEILESTQIIPGAEEWKGKGIERSIKAAYEEIAG